MKKERNVTYMEPWEYQNIQSKIQEESDARIIREMHNMQQSAAPSSSGPGLSMRAIVSILIGLAVFGATFVLAGILPTILSAAFGFSAVGWAVVFKITAGVLLVIAAIVAAFVYRKMREKNILD